MNHDLDRERKLARVHEAVARMAQHSETLDPLNFAVWYDYATGGSPRLRQRLDAAVASGTRVPHHVVRELFLNHLASDDPGGAFAVAARLMARTAAVSEMAQQVMRKQQSVGQILEDEMVQLRNELALARVRATVDSLTNLTNRRAFDAQLEASVERLRGSSADSAALLLLDIDHFKAINDQHGHSHGDRALRMVSTVLQTQAGPLMSVARIGGDEFAVLLAVSEKAQVLALAEQLRQRVADTCVAQGDALDPPAPITVSIGAALFQDGDSAQSWLDRADQALYASKQSGRNRVSWAWSDTPARARSAH